MLALPYAAGAWQVGPQDLLPRFRDSNGGLMASDNDWYSDESDEAFYRAKETSMWEKMGRLNDEIVHRWEQIKEKTNDVKKMEEDFVKMDEEWNTFMEWKHGEADLL